MKKVMFFLILTIGWLGLSGQNQKPNNKGAWFMFENRQYNITMSDLIEISKGADQMVAWKSYHLSNGENFIPINPKLWVKRITEIITKIDGIKPLNLADSLLKGTIVSWTDDISGTITNYGLSMNGKEFVANANFSGRDDFKGLNYKGYIILKLYEPCINILEPNNIVVAVPVPKPKEEEKREEKREEKKKNESLMDFVEPEPCSILNFTATPSSFKKRKGQLTLTWKTKNTSFVDIEGVGSNLFSSGSANLDVFFGKRGDSIAFTLNAFQSGKDPCKVQTINVFRKPMSNRLIFKKIPDWVEGPIYVGIIEETLRRWVVPAVFSKNATEFHPVDANPQAMLPQKKGFNPNLMVSFSF